jgi:hypothetical protein
MTIASKGVYEEEINFKEQNEGEHINLESQE